MAQSLPEGIRAKAKFSIIGFYKLSGSVKVMKRQAKGGLPLLLVLKTSYRFGLNS